MVVLGPTVFDRIAQAGIHPAIDNVEAFDRKRRGHDRQVAGHRLQDFDTRPTAHSQRHNGDVGSCEQRRGISRICDQVEGVAGGELHHW